MPKTEFRCNAKPSLFAYPPALEEKKAENQEKIQTAVLSITNKKKAQKADGGKAKESTPTRDADAAAADKDAKATGAY